MAARKPALTGLYVFMAAKREEQQERALTMSDMMQLWKALPESERKEYETRADEEQKRYLDECFNKYKSGGADLAEDLAEEEEEDSAPERVGAEELAVQLPLARVTKIIKLNNELVKIGRDACFLVTKASAKTTRLPPSPSPSTPHLSPLAPRPHRSPSTLP